jgi:uncharacterized membrane protein YphA (DoxX/SURF4 family)
VSKVKLFLSLETIFRIIIGGIFIWSGLLKIINPLEFARNILNYRLFSEELAFLGAIILPWLEFLIGLCLITGFFRQGASILAVGLFGGFIGLVIITLVRGIDTNCGCFGPLSHRVGLTLLLNDALLFGASLYLFLVYRRNKSSSESR